MAPLYRHWTLIDSMRHATAIYAKLQMWTRGGTEQLLKFFARVG